MRRSLPPTILAYCPAPVRAAAVACSSSRLLPKLPNRPPGLPPPPSGSIRRDRFASRLAQPHPLVCRSSAANGTAYPIAPFNTATLRSFTLLDSPFPIRAPTSHSYRSPEKSPPLVRGQRRRA